MTATPTTAPTAGQLPASDYTNPESICDLVLQGGLTSGVVYPNAVLELATRYRFRCIGGASAGAIVAAATAAAELGRRKGGFEKLAWVSRELAQPGKLLSLFQATRSTRPLLELLLSYIRIGENPAQGRRKWLHTLVSPLLRRSFIVGGLTGLVVLAILAVTASVGKMFSSEAASGWHWVAFALGVALGLLCAFGGFVVQLYREVRFAFRRGEELISSLERNHHGICTGLHPEDSKGECLTEYLDRCLNDLAGLSERNTPLTFNDLAKCDPQPIELALMTSNLSLQRPFRFPLKEDLFLYNPEELGWYFPLSVMQALANAPAPEGFSLATGCPYRFLPRGNELPVLVAVRISLSFPLLFSAVPLYTLKQSYYERKDRVPDTAITAEDLQLNLFSDGGIVSNFPIHMFDRWLPDYPTFGINLAEMPDAAFSPEEEVKSEYLSRPVQPGQEGTQMQMASPKSPPNLQAVYLPRADDMEVPEWRPLENLIDLAKAIFYTAKNHRDNLQSLLPSYRERIATIRLRANEGGLNLTMPPEVIEEIMGLGSQAGRCLRDEFRFDHHRWVRFRVIMAELERELGSMTHTLDERYRSLLREAQSKPDLPYPCSQEWIDEAFRILSQFQNQIKAIYSDRTAFFTDETVKVPEPHPVKRLVPPE